VAWAEWITNTLAAAVRLLSCERVMSHPEKLGSFTATEPDTLFNLASFDIHPDFPITGGDIAISTPLLILALNRSILVFLRGGVALRESNSGSIMLSMMGMLGYAAFWMLKFGAFR